MEIKIHCKYDELVNPKQLKNYEKNRNKHPKDQIKRLAKLFEYQGIRHPIIYDRNRGIAVGHGRKEAALLLGMESFPVVYQEFESDDQFYAFCVSDNAIQEWADLDLSGINADLEFLDGATFDIDWLGVENFKIEVAEKEGNTDEDSVPDNVDTRVKSGDLWALGEHRLLCGDSTSIDAVEKLMGGEKADMVFTDPPYGVSYVGGHNQKKRKGIKGDTLAGDDLTDLFAASLSCAEMVTKEYAAFYIWFANGKAVETFSSFAKLNLSVRAVLCWYKIKSGLGAFMSQYIPNYEPCIYAFKNGCSPQWFGPTDEKTVWELKKERANEYHPTQKPVELPERAIKNSSKSGDIILDLFGGSGSTLIACEKTNRKCYMMELDPKYCDVILRRWEDFTGETAQLLPEISKDE